MRSDADLAAAAAGGNRDAFGEIVERYGRLVCAVACAGTRDVAAGQDVAQEAFVAAWRALPTLREPARLKSWLTGITRNLVNNRARREGGRRHEDLEAVEATSPDPSPLDAVLERERQALVRRALDALPEGYREPLLLFYWEQQSVRAVAETLDLSEDAVKQRLSRGRVLLKEQIAETVDAALEHVRPGKVFVAAVVAALPALSPPGAGAAVLAAAAGKEGASAASAVGLGAALWGPLLGVLGGYIGARASIENTSSARERAFMVRVAWLAAGLALAFGVVEIAGLLLLPQVFANTPAQVAVIGGYTAILVTFIVRSNQRQRQIQREEGVNALAPAPGAVAQKSAIYGSFAGGIFGGLCWMGPITVIARDWVFGIFVLGCAVALFVAISRAVLRRPERYFALARIELGAVIALNALGINLRWEHWMEAYRRSWLYEPSSDLPVWMINVLLAVIGGWCFWRLRDLERSHARATTTTTA
jgi:RNA polymerase sigma factor (sigma-70 family)